MSLPRRQLLLDIHQDATRTLENFVPGTNLELLSRLDGLSIPECRDAIYLWGSAGCGRSHLLQGAATRTASTRPVVQFPCDDTDAATALPQQSLLVVDDVQCLDDTAQANLFRRFNDSRRLGLSLLIAGTTPPGELALREDLRTRIGQCLVFEVKPLSDEEKADAIGRFAHGRGMRLDEAVVSYLMRHGRRDLPSLMDNIEALDHASLEQKRPATLPLLKEILQLSTDSRKTP